MAFALDPADHYAVLGVPCDADDAAVRAAWRTLCRKYHPDTARDEPDALERFGAVNAAYAVLNHPDRRFAYDLQRGGVPVALPPAALLVESPYPMPPQRKHGMTAALIAAFVALPAIALTLPGVPGQVAAMLPREDPGISGFAKASFGTVRRLLSPAGFGGARAAERPAAANAPATLPDLDQATITSARLQLTRVTRRHGSAGVAAYAEACAERATSFATWQAQDFCVAFDLAADRFEPRAAMKRYARLGADPAAATARIARIGELLR